MYELNDSQHFKLSCRTIHDTYRDVGQLVVIVLHGVRTGVVQQQQDFTSPAFKLAIQVENTRLEYVGLNPSLLV